MYSHGKAFATVKIGIGLICTDNKSVADVFLIIMNAKHVYNITISNNILSTVIFKITYYVYYIINCFSS